MDDGASPVIGLTVFVLIIIINNIFYGFRAAVDNLSDISIDKRVEEGSKKAMVIQRYLDEPTDFTYKIQMLTVITNAILAVVEVCLFPRRVWIVGILLFCIVILGMFTPQKIAARKPDKWAFGLVYPVQFFLRLFFPLFVVIDKSSDLVIRICGLDPNASVDDVTEDEIISMVNDGHEQGVLLESEAEMIQNIFEFGDKEAKDIMTHRKNIVAVDSEMKFSEVLAFMQEKSNSRFPVFKDDIDNIIGVIHIKDVLVHSQDQEIFSKGITQIDGLIREIDLIPETRNINALFKDMQSNKSHMVIVVDEYGQTAGLVAMEDILEEIVGNILDEYDEDENSIIRQPDGSFLMSGMSFLEEVGEILGVEFDVEDYETLNGFLISKIDKIPSEEDTFVVESDGWLFHVLVVKNKIIQTVAVSRIEKTENTEPNDNSCQFDEKMVE